VRLLIAQVGGSEIGIVRREGLLDMGVGPRGGRSDGEVTQRHCTLGREHCRFWLCQLPRNAMKRWMLSLQY
jgi:hypothetical protein